MSAGVFVIDVVATLVISGALLHKYGDLSRQRILVTLGVLVAWYFSFLIVLILPLDVSSTVYRQCLRDEHNSSSAVCQGQPYSLLDADVLPRLWRVLYWTSQILTWILLPIMQSFSQAGEFTFSGKLKSALWDNAVFYSSYLLIAIILLVYIAAQPGLHLTHDKIQAIAASASNTWGLFVLVLMLGYGLVEVPRSLWNRSRRGHELSRAYFKVAKLMGEKSDAESHLDDVVAAVSIVDDVVTLLDAQRSNVETILQKIPLEMLEKVKRRQRSRLDSSLDNVEEKSLVKLHADVIGALQAYNRTEAQWSDYTDHVLELELVHKNMMSDERKFIHDAPHNTWCAPCVEWYWKCRIQPLLLRCLAILSAVLSLLIIWSEVTMFSIKPTLSVFAGIVSVAADDHNYFIIEVVSFCTLSYLCLCTYFTVFKIRVLNIYYLASNHHSDEFTLLFSGALLCRLTPPLCLNFLSLIHMDSHVIHQQSYETAYTQIMGHMDVVSIISDYFNIYFPIALLLLASSTYFSLAARCLSVLGIRQFVYQDSEVTLELIEEGKEHIKREKRRRQRLEESAHRRRWYPSKYCDVEANSSTQRAASDDGCYRMANLSSPDRSLWQEPSKNIFDDL